MKNVKLILIILGIILSGKILFLYHTISYDTTNQGIMYNLFNGMVVGGSDVSIDEINVLKQFTGSIFADPKTSLIFLPGGSRSFDNSIQYKYIDINKTITVYVRAMSKKVWNLQFTDLGDGCRRDDGKCTIINTPMIPVILQDLVVEQSGYQTILQGTGGSRVEQIKNNF